MANEKILIVDDEEDILELLRHNLQREGYKVVSAQSGEDAVSMAGGERPDLVILDLMLPGIDGMTVCRIIKGGSMTAHIPVIMLTAKGQESDVIGGLEQGADDYITKPFSPRILLARVKAVLRRKAEKACDDKVITIGKIEIDLERHRVLAAGEPVELTHTEFGILQALARRPGFVMSRYQIVDAIHGTGYVVSDRAVDVQIVSLRKKLGPLGEYIETVRGAGYRVKE